MSGKGGGRWSMPPQTVSINNYRPLWGPRLPHLHFSWGCNRFSVGFCETSQALSPTLYKPPETILRAAGGDGWKNHSKPKQRCDKWKPTQESIPMCAPLQYGLWPPPAQPGAGCWMLGAGAGLGCGTVGPAVLGWWPHSFLPAVPPALPAGSHLSPLPRLYELASPLAPGCTRCRLPVSPHRLQKPTRPVPRPRAAQRRARPGRQPGSGAGKVPVPLGGASRGAPNPSPGGPPAPAPPPRHGTPRRHSSCTPAS